MVERARVIVHAAAVNGLQTAEAGKRLESASENPLGVLLKLDPEDTVFRFVIRELAHRLDALRGNERLEFAQAAYGTGVIPQKVHQAVHKYFHAGEWAVELSPGFRVLIALNPHTETRTLAALVLTDDAATVYSAARRLIEKAWEGPYPLKLRERFRVDLNKALERWEDDPRLYRVLRRLYTLSWDKKPTLDSRLMFNEVRDDYQKTLMYALQTAAKGLTLEEKEDVLESARKGGFHWGLVTLLNFGSAAKEAFIEALRKSLGILDEEARAVFARIYGDIEDLKPAIEF